MTPAMENSPRSSERVATMAASGEQAGELVLFDGAGKELARYPVANIYPVQHEDDSLPTDSISFSEWFPLPAGAVKVELQANGKLRIGRQIAVVGRDRLEPVRSLLK